MKVIDTLTQVDFHGAFQKLLEWYKCLAAGGDYFKEDLSFMCILSIKCPYEKSLEIYCMHLVYGFKYSYLIQIIYDHIYLTSTLDPNTYLYTRSECTWE